jgi:hypothetical protein
VGLDTNWAGVGLSLLLFRRTSPWLDTTLYATPGRWGEFHALRVDEMGYMMINDVKYYSDQATLCLGTRIDMRLGVIRINPCALVRCTSSLI